MKVGDITKRADSVSVHTNCPRMAVQNYRAGKMKQQALGRLRSPAVGVEKKKKRVNCTPSQHQVKGISRGKAKKKKIERRQHREEI